MRGIAAGLTLLIASAGSAQQVRKGGEAKEHELPEMQCKVWFPSQPKADSKPLATRFGVVEMLTRKVDTRNDLVLSVTLAVYPDPDHFKDVAAKTVLDGVRDGLKGTDGTVKADRDVTAESDDGTVPGREFRVEAGKNVIRCRAFLVGHRLYQVMAAGTRDAAGGKDADKFLDSFKLQTEK